MSPLLCTAALLQTAIRRPWTVVGQHLERARSRCRAPAGRGARRRPAAGRRASSSRPSGRPPVCPTRSIRRPSSADPPHRAVVGAGVDRAAVVHDHVLGAVPRDRDHGQGGAHARLASSTPATSPATRSACSGEARNAVTKWVHDSLVSGAARPRGRRRRSAGPRRRRCRRRSAWSARSTPGSGTARAGRSTGTAPRATAAARRRGARRSPPRARGRRRARSPRRPRRDRRPSPTAPGASGACSSRSWSSTRPRASTSRTTASRLMPADPRALEPGHEPPSAQRLLDQADRAPLGHQPRRLRVPGLDGGLDGVLVGDVAQLGRGPR